MRLSKRVTSIKPSATLAITNKAREMRAQGIDVVSFGAGEPDFDTPENIKKAAIAAIEKGHTKYTAVDGIPELKDAIIAKLKRDHGLEYSRSQIIVSVGGKQAFYNLAQAFFDPGDEVIVPAPYWVSYPDMIALAEATPVILPCHESNGFKMTAHQLEKHITPKTKAVVINSPSNPTGAVYTREELETIAQVLVKHKIYAITDDIYEKILFDGQKFFTIAQAGEEMRKLTLLLNGVSKAYAMTGWRIGYTAGPSEIVSAMAKIQGQSTSNPASVSQWAAVEALNGPQEPLEAMRREFEKRRDYIVDRFNAIPGIHCYKPGGAFYVFPNVEKLYGTSYGGKKINNSRDFAAYLLEEARVAVVPGIEFGAAENIRLSYATSMAQIKEGLDRIEAAVKKLA